MKDADPGATPARQLYVDWPQYHRLIERLAVMVFESGYTFESLLCLARGGMRVGDVISRVFEVPLAILATSSYREAEGTRAGALDIADFITTTGGPLHGRLLLVDDMADSGATLRGIRTHLRRNYPAIVEIRSAVLWYKQGSAVAPDYYVEQLPDNPWIHQPFERYDHMRPADLARSLAAEPGANPQAPVATGPKPPGDGG